MRDTAHLSEVEECIYSRCIDQYYSREKALPLDLVLCARLVRAITAQARKALATILPEFFEREPDGWHQKRCDEEILAFRERSETARQSAAISTSVRQATAKRNAEQDAERTLKRTLSSGSANHKPLAINYKVKDKDKAARRRATPIPEAFALSDSLKAWGVSKGFNDLAPYLETFAARNKASGKTYLDWDQAFMNAVREDWYGLRRLNGQQGSGRESRISEQERVLGALTGRKGRIIEPTD